MKSKLLTQDTVGERTWAVVFDTGDEFMEGLLSFATENGLDASQITAIGAFEQATLAYFDIGEKDYKPIPVNEQVEVLSLVGDITRGDGKPKIHAHCVVGRSDGTTRGGHILKAHVRPTLEVIVTESPSYLHRSHDDATGLALIDLG